MTAWREIGGCDPPDPVLTWALATTSLSEIFCMLLPFTQPGPATTRGGAYRANMHSPPHHLLLSWDARAILAACGMRNMQHCTGWWPNSYFGRRLCRQKLCSLSDMAQDQATLLWVSEGQAGQSNVLQSELHLFIIHCIYRYNPIHETYHNSRE